MQLVRGDLERQDVVELLAAHLANLHELSPPESVHALPLAQLSAPDITFWSVRDAGVLLGCGALRELDPFHGEVKSMRTVAAHLRKGVASFLLRAIIAEARLRGYRRLSLETGVTGPFLAAQALYERFGFRSCGRFADYPDDPDHSCFMTLALL